MEEKPRVRGNRGMRDREGKGTGETERVREMNTGELGEPIRPERERGMGTGEWELEPKGEGNENSVIGEL